MYPNTNFRQDNPAQRLERLEIAAFGTKQKGNIDFRLAKIQDEILSWQIANNMPVNQAKPFPERQIQYKQNIPAPVRQVNYRQNHYRIINQALMQISRQGINQLLR